MRASRRWLAAALIALGLVPGVERVLLTHAHHSPGPTTELAAASESHTPGGLSGCAACQARAALDSLAVDAHPERHGTAPVAPPLPRPGAAPTPAHLDTPPARGPPLRIV